jgi:outer membrane protein
MLKRISIIILTLISFAGFGLGIYNFYQTPKIVYVRSFELVDKYLGTKEARDKFKIQKSEWQSNIDSLTYNYRNSVTKFDSEYKSMNTTERQKAQAYLGALEQQLVDYTKAVEAKGREEDNDRMQAILNQINTYVEEYGQKNGYDVILGTTTSGNVLYAQKYLDITDEVLKGLNQHYQGKK